MCARVLAGAGGGARKPAGEGGRMVVGESTVLNWRSGGRRPARVGAPSIVGVPSHCHTGSWCLSALFPVISAGKRILRQHYVCNLLYSQNHPRNAFPKNLAKPCIEHLPSE